MMKMMRMMMRMRMRMTQDNLGQSCGSKWLGNMCGGWHNILFLLDGAV